MKLQIKIFLFSVLMIGALCSLADGQNKLPAKDIETIKNMKKIFARLG